MRRAADRDRRRRDRKNLTAGKIAATLYRADQIIEMRSIDQREQTALGAERRRQCQSASTRELLRTLDALRECGRMNLE